MATGLKQLALAALCSSALIAVTGVAQAGTVQLSGSALSTAPNPLYGTATSANNVINAPGVTATGSLLYDPTATPNGAFNSATTPWLQQGQVSANTGGSSYYVNWYFTGSESGYVISFHAPYDATPNAVNFTEGNQNNNAYGGGPALANGSYQLMGTSHYGAGAPLAFDLTWTDFGGTSHTLDNSSAQSAPGLGAANLIFSYLDINSLLSGGPYINLTTSTDSNWFAFALNDNGGNDDNHDDFVGFAQIVTDTGGGPGQGVTPIPAALPLFGSVLGGGIAVGRWRKRRKKKAAV